MPSEPPPADGPRLPDELLLNQGLAQLHLGQLPQARASLERLLSQNPAHFDAHYLLATVLGQQGEMEAALRAFDQALALRDNHPLAHGNRAALLLHLGRHAEALQAYDQAIALKPDFAAAHFRRGVVLQALGQPEAALQSHARALQLQPALDEARQAWLALKAQLGDQAPQAPETPADPTQAEAGFDARDNQRAAAKYLSQVESLTTADAAGSGAEATWQALAERGQALARLQQQAEAAQRSSGPWPLPRKAPCCPACCWVRCAPAWAGTNYPRCEAHIEARPGHRHRQRGADHVAAGQRSGLAPAMLPAVWRAVAGRHSGRAAWQRQRQARASASPTCRRAPSPSMPMMTALAEVFELRDRSRFDIHAYAYGKPGKPACAIGCAPASAPPRGPRAERCQDRPAPARAADRHRRRPDGLHRGHAPWHAPAPAGAGGRQPDQLPRLLGLDGFDYIVGDATHSCHRAARALRRATGAARLLPAGGPAPSDRPLTPRRGARPARAASCSALQPSHARSRRTCSSSGYAAAAPAARQRALAGGRQRGHVAAAARARRARRGRGRAAGVRRARRASASTWRATPAPTCSSTPCPTTPWPRSATRSGPGCRPHHLHRPRLRGAQGRSILQAAGLPELVTSSLADYGRWRCVWRARPTNWPR